MKIYAIDQYILFTEEQHFKQGQIYFFCTKQAQIQNPENYWEKQIEFEIEQNSLFQRRITLQK